MARVKEIRSRQHFYNQHTINVLLFLLIEKLRADDCRWLKLIFLFTFLVMESLYEM